MKKTNEGAFMNQISNKASVASTARLGRDVIIHDFVTVYHGAVIGDGAELYECTVVGKPPKAPGSTARSLTSGASTCIGEGCILSPGAVVYSGVTIGAYTLLGDHCSIREQCRIGSHVILGRNVAVNYNASVGDYTKVMDSAIITGNMVVEDHVFIGMLVITSNDNAMGRLPYSNSMRGPHIKRYARIGSGANLLPGVVIGENSIVAAQALVSTDVPDYALAMGIPARIKPNASAPFKEQ